MPAARKAPPPPEATGQAELAFRPAIKSPVAMVLFLAVASAAVAGDLLAKQHVFQSLLNDPAQPARNAGVSIVGADDVAAARMALAGYQRPVLPGVKFSLSTNPGVVFGLAMPRGLVAAATVLTTALVFYFFAVTDVRARLARGALALILGGALGNLYDRLFSEVAVPGFSPIRHQVRDFIDCSGLHYPWVFNPADIWLVVGVAMLVAQWAVTAWRRPEPNQQAARQGS